MHEGWSARQLPAPGPPVDSSTEQKPRGFRLPLGAVLDTLSRDGGSLASLWTTEGPNPIHSESGNSTAQLPKNQNNRFSLHFFKLLGSWAVELPDSL